MYNVPNLDPAKVGAFCTEKYNEGCFKSRCQPFLSNYTELALVMLITSNVL